jgi:type IV secretion system protein VirB9
VTDRHAYSLLFEPGGASATVHRLVFTYPEMPSAPVVHAAVVPVVSNDDLVSGRLKAQPVPVNANYSIAFGDASDDLRPALVFDDGRFTYLKWPGNREIPAVFEIRRDGTELVANTRVEGDLVVVDRIARGLMLRSGTAVASIRNEAFDPDATAPVAGTTVPNVARTLKE